MEHVRGAPHHPRTQGKIERWHQTLKDRILLDHDRPGGRQPTRHRDRDHITWRRAGEAVRTRDCSRHGAPAGPQDPLKRRGPGGSPRQARAGAEEAQSGVTRLDGGNALGVFSGWVLPIEVTGFSEKTEEI